MTTRTVILGVIALSIAACNQRAPVFDREVLVTAPSYARVPPVPSVSSLSIQFDRGAVSAGATVRGTVTLNSPADGASAVTLSAPGGAVDLNPALVVVPAGSRQASFTVTARNVSSDVNATVIASMNGLSAQAILPVWAVVPMFYSFSVEGQTPYAELGRFTPQNADFHAYCYRSQVLGEVLTPNPQDRWFFGFGAPDGTPLRAGVYTATGGGGTARTYVNLGQPDTYCNPSSSGTFTVREIELGPSQTISKFWVTFEQPCVSFSGARTGVLRGELRLTNVRLLTDATPSSCFR